MSTQTLARDDLIVAADLASQALKRLQEDQWQQKSSHMEWTRFETILHVCSALHGYAIQLATRADERTARLRPDSDQYSGADLPSLLANQAALLNHVAIASPPQARGWHSAGPPDAEGFLVMGCAEILLHAWDCLQGTGHNFDPSNDLAGRVASRLFPWSPADAPGWARLLFATGRADLPGRESPGDSWSWHPEPLDEWDGAERRSAQWRGQRA